jgi:excisionase family DNA binding protein
MCDEIMDPQALALYLKVDVKTINYLVDIKRLPHSKIGRNIRFKKESIDAWVKAIEVRPESMNDDKRFE